MWCFVLGSMLLSVFGSTLGNPGERSMDRPTNIQMGDISGPFPINAAQVNEIKDTFLRRIREAQKEGSDGTFFNTHIDLMKATAELFSRCTLLVIDIGGTSLKISKLTCSPEDSEASSSYMQSPCKYTITECGLVLYQYPDTTDVPNDKRPEWNEWVADRIVDFYGSELPKETTFAALTFSYALNQTSIADARIKRISKNFCFLQDEHTFSKNIVEVLNNSLKARNVNVHVTCVMNDSTATYMAGLLRKHENIIGIVVGTGTNASFDVLKEDGETRVLYNSEWGITEVPHSLLTSADLMVVEDLMAKNIVYNIIDVLVGGYKFTEIVLNRLLVLYPKLHGEYRDKQDIVHSVLNAINSDINSDADVRLRNGNRELYDALKLLASGFRVRGMRILAAMISAIIEARGEGIKRVTLVLNGTILSMPHLRDLLKTEVEEICPGIDFDLKYFKNASLEGAAFTSLVHSLDAI